MKNILTILFLLFFTNVFATTYYVSAGGNDANSGTTTIAPWATIAKVNSFAFVAGDQVLFNSGNSFYGSITINQSGSAGNPITYGAYGSGANPIITGFTTVSGWTNLGGNIWESIGVVSALSTCSMVVINGVNTPMGRFPNSSYATISSGSTTSITSSSLSSTWTGADVVFRANMFIINRTPITSQAGTTINFTAIGDGRDAQTGWGFFIENSAATLDVQNEWYYNSSTKKIRIYSTVSPTNVQVSTLDDLVSISYHDYITFNNIDFTGANNSFFNLGSTKHITVQNCNLNFSGAYGIWGRDITNDLPASATACSFTGNTFNHVNNSTFDLDKEYGNATINSNIIKNNGVIVGMSKSADGQNYAIKTEADNTTITYNEIDSSGYIGIGFDGLNGNVTHNFVNTFCLVKQDGGGIYTSKAFTGKIISYNTVINGVGNYYGTPYNTPADLAAEGIYLDNASSERTNGVQVLNNTVYGMAHTGLFLHNVINTVVRNNTIYDCGYMSIDIENDRADFTTSGLTIKNNIFFSKASTQFCARYQTQYNDLATWGVTDSNYYARPIDDNIVFDILIPSETTKTLAQWQTYSSQDAHSNKSPKAITHTDSLRFEYNETGSNKIISLPYNYEDVRSVQYNGTITLQPYTSAVLIQNGSSTSLPIIAPPTVNAGPDQNIAPSTTALTATVTWANTHSGSYLWTKLSGTGGTLINPTSISTALSGLTNGVYVYRITVTQDDSQTAFDDVQVTVTTPPVPGAQNIIITKKGRIYK